MAPKKLTLPIIGHSYQLLNKNAPVSGDCGRLCGKACCQDDSGQMGIYLLPGEEQLFSGREKWLNWEVHQAEDYDFPNSWRGNVYFVRCAGSCPRELRPLQCRTYPLAPHIASGYLFLIYETLQLPYACPLISKRIPLRQEFVLAVSEVWQLLTTNILVRDLVDWDSRWREKNNQALTVVRAVKI